MKNTIELIDVPERALHKVLLLFRKLKLENKHFRVMVTTTPLEQTIHFRIDDVALNSSFYSCGLCFVGHPNFIETALEKIKGFNNESNS